LRIRLVLPLMKDQQVVEAFLPHPPQEALTDRIGSGSMIRNLEDFNGTRRRHAGETDSKLAVVITEQILRSLPIRGGFPKLLRHPGIVEDQVTPIGITFRDWSSMMKNAKSERKKRSLTCKKSQVQTSLAWLCRNVLHF